MERTKKVVEKVIEPIEEQDEFLATQEEEPIEEQEVKLEPKKVEEPIINTRLRWKKIGGGSLRWKNRIIKPGEVFEANLEDLPKAFMDTLVCLDKEGLKKVEIAVKKETLVIENLFKLVKSKVSKSHWDVVGDNGKPINEAPLEKGSAEELLLALNG